MSEEDGYTEDRPEFKYYSKVIEFAREYAPAAQSVLDVGPYITQVVTRFDWIPSKTTIDLVQRPELPGVKALTGDFLSYPFKEHYDLVICLQVLEHIREVEQFAQRLLSTAKIAIISVPYRWPAGTCPDHIHDPVDETKLLNWTKKDWLVHSIEEDDCARLVAVFKGS